MSQLVPYLWNENLSLKKEKHIWVEKVTRVITIDKEDNRKEHTLSKIEIGKDKSRKVTLYNQSGNVREVNHSFIQDKNTQVYKTREGDKEIRKYNDDGNLISEIWIFPDGSKDEKNFTYKKDKLIKIVEKDEFDTSIEELKYKEGKLSKILSINKKGKVLMTRKILYNSQGKIKETQRVQDGKINKKVFYKYGKRGRLQRKEEVKINRLKGGNMPPEIYTYKYHKNGTLREERWIIYLDESRQDKKYVSTTTYNDKGLEVRSSYKSYIHNSEEITIYEYKLKGEKKKKEKFDKKLRQHIDRKDFVKIYRTGTEGEANIDGFILQMSRDFLLIQNEQNFLLNGYSIIRKDRFDAIRISKIEKFQKKVMEKEGIIDSEYGIDVSISLQSLETIFKNLQQSDYFVIVECEDLTEPTFTIGEISKVSKKSVGVRYFNPQGVIDKKPTKIKYDDITLVTFDDRYINLYRKYLKEEK